MKRIVSGLDRSVAELQRLSPSLVSDIANLSTLLDYVADVTAVLRSNDYDMNQVEGSLDFDDATERVLERAVADIQAQCGLEEPISP